MTDKREFVAGEPDPEADAFDESQFGLDALEGDPGIADEDGEGEPEPVADSEETLARAGGWCPKEEWRGDPAKWVDAKSFNDSASPARMRERFQRFEEERAKEKEEYSRRIERIEKMSAATIERQRAEFAERIKGFEKQRDQQVIEVAAELGAEAAQKHRGEWETFIADERKKEPTAPEASTTPQPKAEQPAASPREVNDWIAAHPQYKTDSEFGGAAFWAMDKIHKEMGDKPLTEQFAELDRRMAKRFPEYYPGARTDAKPANGNGAPPANARQMDGVRVSTQKHQSYSSRLSATERNVGKMFVARGDFKSLEEYAKDLIDNA